MLHRARAFLPVLLLLVLAGCGSGQGDRDRPQPLATFPADGAELDNVVEEVAVLYDDPIYILNPNVVWMIDSRGQVQITPSVDADDPRILRLRTSTGSRFAPGRTVITVGAGLVANGLNQYDTSDFTFSFRLGTGPNLFVATRGTNVVAEIDPDTFAGIGTTATPGGRAPVGLAGVQVGADIRIWTQLASGGGDGRALATFAPGDAGMTEIPLTHAPGGDLETDRRAVALSRDGRYVFAAYRDSALQQVRVHQVDVDTATEIATLVLSAPPSPSTTVVSLRPGTAGNSVFVSCTSDAGDTLHRIKIATWEEDDIGKAEGTDGQELVDGAGALAPYGLIVYQGPATAPTALLTVATPATGGGSLFANPSDIAGSPTDLLVTADGRWLLESLAAFDGTDGIARRNLVRPFNPTAVAVSGETGAANAAATSVRALVPYRTQLRFVALLDNGALATYHWNGADVEQDDLDPLLDGVQAADVSSVAPDPVAATFVSGIYLR